MNPILLLNKCYFYPLITLRIVLIHNNYPRAAIMESTYIPMDVDVEEKMFTNVAHDDTLIVNKSVLVPVIIEELDESAINDMDVDMGEFVEAKALKYQVIFEKANRNLGPVEPPSINEDKVDTTDTDVLEEQETESSREDQLTQQFLNGELTFTEYSLKMDNNRLDFFTANEKKRILNNLTKGFSRINVVKLAPIKISFPPSFNSVLFFFI